MLEPVDVRDQVKGLFWCKACKSVVDGGQVQLRNKNGPQSYVVLVIEDGRVWKRHVSHLRRDSMDRSVPETNAQGRARFGISSKYRYRCSGTLPIRDIPSITTPLSARKQVSICRSGRKLKVPDEMISVS